MLSKRFAKIQNNNRPRFTNKRKRSRKATLSNLAKSLGVELKFYDKFANNLSLVESSGATNGLLNPAVGQTLSSMKQGNGESDREGRRVTWKSMFITGVITVNLDIDEAAMDIAPIVFLALIQDNQTNGLQFASQSVYINPSGSVLLSTQLLRNLEQSKRFKVLKTWRQQLQQTEAIHDGTNIEQGGYATPFTMFHTFRKNVLVNHSITDEGILNSTDLSISLIGWTSNDTQIPLLSYNSRLRFYG